MTEEEAIDFLNRRLNYESRGMPDQAELRVDRTAMLLDRLGRPQERLRIVHVAGTKGKGSTALFTARLLEESGLSVGLHTSPHLVEVEERFRINGSAIPRRQMAELLQRMRPAIEEIDEGNRNRQAPLTFFEVTTALALLYFAEAGAEVAVVEVGMGGRLDSTNVVDPAVSIITSISLDHTRQLGSTVEAIAGEKAGIIKPGRPIVSCVTDPRAESVIRRRATELEAPYFQRDDQFFVSATTRGLCGLDVSVSTFRRTWPTIRLRAVGDHQAQNLAAALTAIDLLDDPNHPLPSAPTGSTLTSYRLPGRFEVIRRQPTVIYDVAHNPAAFEAIGRTLERIVPRHHSAPRVLIFATSSDKDWMHMLQLAAPHFTEIVLTQYTTNPRALPLADAVAGARQLGLRVTGRPTPREAWEYVCGQHALPTEMSADGVDSGDEHLAQDEPLVLFAGSFYLIGELLTPAAHASPRS